VNFGIDASAVTRRVNLLGARGRLKPVRSVEKQRLMRLALTPEGEAMAARKPAINASVVDKLLSGFTPEETGFLGSMLRRVLANSGDFAGLTHNRRDPLPPSSP
jgi:DNA-binding MarR family transcriptional regulator